MNAAAIWLIILLVLTSPFWIVFLHVYITTKIEERRCPACKGQTSAILAVGPDLQALCRYHGIRRRIIEKAEKEVLGEWPNVG